MEEQFLHLFITEEIYQLPEETLSPPVQKEPEPVTPKLEEPPQPAIEKPVIHRLAIWTPPLTTKDRELLSKILQAVNEDINKCHLMEGLAAYQPNFEKLLCFGYQKELELRAKRNFERYKPTTASGKQVLISVAPAELHDSKSEKANLWLALQEMFLK